MNLPIHRLALATATLSMVALTGCTLGSNSAPATPIVSSLGTIHGRAFGGSQPITDASIYVYAAGTGGYGGASTDLSTTVPTTDGNGDFTITGDYTCTVGQQVYLYVKGGNTGGGTNSSSGLLAILGQCPASGTLAVVTPTVWVNEISTVAAAYAIAGFATDATHVSDDEGVGGNTTSTLATTGMATAFANSANLENIATGTAYAATPTTGSTGTVPQAQINTIADILAACVDTSDTTGMTPGPSATCSTLFANATSAGTSGGTTPTDTATAAINIAHNPTANVDTLFKSIAATPPYPAESTEPPDFTISILYPQAGTGTVGIAIDGNDNAFATYGGGNTVFKITPTGIVTSYIGTATTNPAGIALAPRHLAIDTSNNIWVPTTTSSTTNYLTITEFDNNLNLTNQYKSYDGTAAVHSLNALAFDASGDVWAVGTATKAIELSSSGTYLNEITGLPTGTADIAINPNGTIAISGGNNGGTLNNGLYLYTGLGAAIGTEPTGTGGGLDEPNGVISDQTGNFWISNQSDAVVSEFSAGGAPVSSTGYSTTSSGDLLTGDFDGLGNYFTGGATSTGGIYELNSSGAQIGAFTPPTGDNEFMGVDGAGDIWFGGNKTIGEMIGIAAPKVTPISTATFDGKLNTRP